MMSSPASALLCVRGLVKSFGTVRALDGVDLEFAGGNIHAVLGENGAGKSTLMHVLDGVCRPDAGKILVDGTAVRFASPRDARRAGIGMVHQHFALVDALSVAENLALSLTAAGDWRFDNVAVAQAARTLAERVGLDLPPAETLVRDLAVGARQRLEILKALAGAGRVLILDEPTAVLTPQEVRQLFVMLRQLRAQGRLVLFITHKLHEVSEVADRVTVMRQGRIVGTFGAGELSERQLAEHMVGRWEPPAARPQRSHEDAAVALQVAGLTMRDERGVVALDDVAFAVRRGEILGIAGVDGNGQRELFDVLSGLKPPSRGSVSVAGKPLAGFNSVAVRAAGIGHIPPDRHREGLVLAMSVAENLLLHRAILRRFSRGGLFRRQAAWRYAAELARQYKIKLSSLDAAVSSLSGGNQQRVIVAREIAEEPPVLVAANPTRGLDLAATRAVADALRAVAADGCAVLLISTDLDEVLDLSDRIGVLFRGRLSKTLTPPVDAQRLGLLMAGAATQSQETTAGSREVAR